MNFWGGVLAFLGIACVVPTGAPFLIYLAPLFFIGAVMCFKAKEPEKSVKPTKPTGGSSSEGDYDGRTHGDVIDLGGGQCFDRNNPDGIVDGVNWCRDNHGGYYSPGTGETITYNNGTYNYNDPQED